MDTSVILKELQFKAVSSSGAGGQHVNKTATKVEVVFPVVASEGLTETEKEWLQQKLSSRITSEGNLILQCGETRSQHRNKKIVIDRLLALLQQHIQPAKKRKKTKPSKKAIQKRLDQKKNHTLKKNRRKPPTIE